MRRLLVLLLFLVPAAAAGQEGSARFTRAVENDFELPEGREELRDLIPAHTVTPMALLFDGSASLMKPAPDDDGEGADPAAGRARRLRGFVERLKARSPSRSDQEVLVETYTSFADGTVVETREFMGRTFLVRRERPAYEWKLAGEQREFLGFLVQKAMTEHAGSTIEAWFTPQVPVEAGPGPYGGLPGLILLVSVDGGRTVYTATEVDLNGDANGPIAPPEEGSEVSADEYERIVAEKLEELRMLRAGRGRRPPFQMNP